MTKGELGTLFGSSVHCFPFTFEYFHLSPSLFLCLFLFSRSLYEPMTHCGAHKGKIYSLANVGCKDGSCHKLSLWLSHIVVVPNSQSLIGAFRHCILRLLAHLIGSGQWCHCTLVKCKEIERILIHSLGMYCFFAFPCHGISFLFKQIYCGGFWPVYLGTYHTRYTKNSLFWTLLKRFSRLL